MTRAILLAAGQGSRLRPYTDRCPKAMVPLQGRPLLDWQLSALREAGVDEVIVVSGYRGESIDFEGIVKLDNPAFASTNMVWSLLQARPYWGDGFLLCYTDIVYEPRLIQALMAAQGPVSMIVDTGWRAYWQARFEDPLEDAESLRIEAGRVTDIGRRPQCLDEVQGQFTGLVRFDAEGVALLEALLDEAGEQARSMHTTHLLQALIERGVPITSVPVVRGWFEIDNPKDLALAESAWPGFE